MRLLERCSYLFLLPCISNEFSGCKRDIRNFDRTPNCIIVIEIDKERERKRNKATQWRAYRLAIDWIAWQPIRRLSSAILSLFDLSCVANFCCSRFIRIFICFTCINYTKIFYTISKELYRCSLQCYITFFLLNVLSYFREFMLLYWCALILSKYV